MALLEEVFRLSGVPTYTFVEPHRYNAIRVAVRTPGRCVVLEGPSGIGKTTTISRVISELNEQGSVLQLSARRSDDRELINEISGMKDIGTVIIDDFHRLPDDQKHKLSDFMKILADEGTVFSKLILIGINSAGDQLVQIAHDVGMRIDIFKLEANSTEKIEELIGLGERELKISIHDTAYPVRSGIHNIWGMREASTPPWNVGYVNLRVSRRVGGSNADIHFLGPEPQAWGDRRHCGKPACGTHQAR
jgi:type II secretory pathway predicted ATPase ExeA